MAESKLPRKLVAVLAADVSGYSRLMQADDQATLRALTESRALFTARAASHGGHVINAPGDSILAEFASVVGALECAVELQRAFADRNAPLPESRRMRFRIGVNLGDVLVDEAGIYGDGVNVAARLEGLAQPGGICISGSVYEQVEGKFNFRFEDLGEQQVKNIARPVRVYRLPIGADAAVPAPTPLPANRPPFSIVVLPFDNLSGDPEQGYLADAITDDLTTNLSRIAGSFVIARNSAFTYKGKAVDVKQIGRELGVQYALEGSVRRAENRVRVNAQLIETESATNVWAERFDRELGDMLALQDDITGSIARVLRYELIEAESRRSLRERPGNPQAIDYALRAVATTIRDPMIKREHSLAARQLYEEALRLDPKLLMAITGLAGTWVTEVAYGWTEARDTALKEAERLITRAEAIAPNDARLLQIRGMVLLLRRKPELALPDLEAAYARDPNSTQLLLNIGWCKMFLGDPEGAKVHIEQVLRLDPRSFNRGNIHGVLGTANLYLGNYDEAIGCLRLSIEENAMNQPFIRWVLAAACALAGRMDEARTELAEFQNMRPGVGIAQLRRETLSTHPRYLLLRERVYEGLLLSGLAE